MTDECSPPQGMSDESQLSSEIDSSSSFLDDEEEDDEEQWVRGKWIVDGAESIDQIMGMLNEDIKYYETKVSEGWQVSGGDDDLVRLIRQRRTNV